VGRDYQGGSAGSMLAKANATRSQINSGIVRFRCEPKATTTKRKVKS